MITFKTTLPYRFKHSEKRRLFVLLHGYGSNMDDLFAFADELAPFGSVISFDAPQHTPWGGKAWFDLTFTENSVEVSNYNQIVASQVSLQENITIVLSDLQLEWGNVNYLGFSQGAMMVTELLEENRQLVESAVLMSGRSSREKYENIQQTRIFQTHGTSDAVINIEQARQLSSKLEKLVSDYSYKEYEGMAHGISPTCWNDIMYFIKSLHS